MSGGQDHDHVMPRQTNKEMTADGPTSDMTSPHINPKTANRGSVCLLNNSFSVLIVCDTNLKIKSSGSLFFF